MTNQRRDQEGQFTSNKNSQQQNKQPQQQKQGSGMQGGTREQHQQAGRQSHKNDDKR